MVALAETHQHKIDAYRIDLREEVLDQVWGRSEGITRAHLVALFKGVGRYFVEDCISYLLWRGLVVEVTRTHGSAQSEKDHKRLMVFKRSIN